MPKPLISLCMIVGNVDDYIERCLRSFAPIADEIILVRAIGSLEPDDTFRKAIKVCNEFGKLILLLEYKNAPGHEDWPHVDNFSAARQMSFDIAAGTYRFWCDSDDVLACDPLLIHEHARIGAEKGTPVFFFPYEVGGRGVSFPRERMLHRDLHARWINPVHERIGFNQEIIGTCDERAIVRHLPHPSKTGSVQRNLRILESIPNSRMSPEMRDLLRCERRAAMNLRPES